MRSLFVFIFCFGLASPFSSFASPTAGETLRNSFIKNQKLAGSLFSSHEIQPTLKKWFGQEEFVSPVTRRILDIALVFMHPENTAQAKAFKTAFEKYVSAVSCASFEGLTGPNPELKVNPRNILNKVGDDGKSHLQRLKEILEATPSNIPFVLKFPKAQYEELQELQRQMKLEKVEDVIVQGFYRLLAFWEKKIRGFEFFLYDGEGDPTELKIEGVYEKKTPKETDDDETYLKVVAELEQGLEQKPKTTDNFIASIGIPLAYGLFLREVIEGYYGNDVVNFSIALTKLIKYYQTDVVEGKHILVAAKPIRIGNTRFLDQAWILKDSPRFPKDGDFGFDEETQRALDRIKESFEVETNAEALINSIMIYGTEKNAEKQEHTVGMIGFKNPEKPDEGGSFVPMVLLAQNLIKLPIPKNANPKIWDFLEDVLPPFAYQKFQRYFAESGKKDLHEFVTQVTIPYFERVAHLLDNNYILGSQMKDGRIALHFPAKFIRKFWPDPEKP